MTDIESTKNNIHEDEDWDMRVIEPKGKAADAAKPVFASVAADVTEDEDIKIASRPSSQYAEPTVSVPDEPEEDDEPETAAEGNEDDDMIVVKEPVQEPKAQEPAKKDKKETGNKKKAETVPVKEEETVRTAMTTSRGVVYVEPYDDVSDCWPAKHAKKGLKKTLIALAIVIVLFAAVFSILNVVGKKLLDEDKVYPGITLCGKQVSGMTEEQLRDYIETTYVGPMDNSSVIIAIGEDSQVYGLNELFYAPNAANLAKEIYSEGRSGSVISRLYTILKLREGKKNYSINYSANSQAVNTILTSAGEKYNQPRINPSYQIDYEAQKIVFTYGKNGLELTEDSLKETLDNFTKEITETFNAGNGEAKTYRLALQAEETPFIKLQKVNIINDLALETKDASFSKGKTDKDIIISDEKVGFEFDSNQLDQIIRLINSGAETTRTAEELSFETGEVILTKQLYQNVMFRDSLGKGKNVNIEGETEEDSDEAENRSTNIRQAANVLNGYIVLPGESFSFLKALGEVSKEKGFVEAKENYLGFDTPVMGGGISQVASAIYEAAILSSCKIGSHSNYTYKPNFGTDGADAYVNAENNKDFTFTNTSSMPIKITVSFVGNTVTAEIKGTFWTYDDFDGVDVDKIPFKIEKKTNKYLQVKYTTTGTPFQSLSTTDNSKPEGFREVTVYGIKGYDVNVYRCEVVNGEEVKSLVAFVSYKTRTEIVTVGPASKPTEQPTEVPTEVPTDEPTDEPTDAPTEEVTDDPTEAPATPTPEGETTPAAEPEPTPTPAPEEV